MGEIDKLKRELEDTTGSNQGEMQKLLRRGIHILQDLPQFYQKSSVQVKRDVLGSIFPEKLIIEEKNVKPLKSMRLFGG